MRIAVTGATGFVGRYIVKHLTDLGHTTRCWHRPTSDRSGFAAPGFEIPEDRIEWVSGQLDDLDSTAALVAGCEAVVHAALFRPGIGFRGAEGDIVQFVRHNVQGTLRLIESARAAGVNRFVQISTCAVHEKILEDRPLDEAHPLWPLSHYGAHKAALEAFVHSYGFGDGYGICALRPTGVYGLAHPPGNSKWFSLVKAVVNGESVECQRGGKEVHASDVAKAAGVLLTANGIAGEAFNCYDRYVSEYEVATLAQRISGSSGQIVGQTKQPIHQIETGKIRAHGMEFGGSPLLEKTIAQLVGVARQTKD